MMATEEDSILDLRNAARILFDVQAPTPEQLNHVRVLLMRGRLPRSVQGGWTTTMAAVTNLLAKRSLRGRLPADAPPSVVASRALDSMSFAHREELPPLYRDLLRQYFGAVLLRRQAARGTLFFERTVLAGQCLVVVVILGLVVLAVSPAFAPRPREQVLVEQFIAGENERYEILKWIPLDGSADRQRLRVLFRYYSPSGKPIETDRIYAITGGHVALDIGSD
jgi:hypothetical protein